MNRLRSIRSRLWAAALVWMVCATLLGGWAISYAVRNTLQDAFDARVASLLMTAIGIVDVDAAGQPQLDRSIGEPLFEKVYSGWYWLVMDSSRVYLRSRSLWDLELPVTAPKVSSTPILWNMHDALGREIRVAAQTVIVPGAQEPLTFVVSGDLSAMRQEMRRFDLLLFIALGALGIGLVIAVLMQVSFGLKPLTRLARQIEDVRTGSAEKLSPSGTRELDELVDELNNLIEHNRAILTRARDNAKDLAHALKTPLAIMQSAAGQFAEGEGPASREHAAQIAAMERIITRHLTRAATAGPGKRTSTPILPIVEDLARGLKRVHADRALQLVQELDPSLAYNADREDLEEMIGNLLENAFKWAHQCIRISAQADERRLLLTVEDDGPGLEREQAIHAAERGTRFDSRTPGTGLGLAIVTDIAEIYRGGLRLHTSALGGLAAELTLPRSGG